MEKAAVRGRVGLEGRAEGRADPPGMPHLRS